MAYVDGKKEEYNASGYLTSLKDQTGLGYTLSYVSPVTNELERVTHSNGSVLVFTFQNKRVSSVFGPNGTSITYNYNANDLLSQTVSPGSPYVTWTYHYESAQPSLLTGTSVNGVRYSNYDYYPDGRVFHSGLAGGIERDTFVYGTATGSGSEPLTTTTITNAAGGIFTYSFLADGGLYQVGKSNITNCPNAGKFYSYGASTRPRQVIDYNGNRIDYTYDSTMVVTSAKTGVRLPATGKTRLSTYTWDNSGTRLKSVKTYGDSTSDPRGEVIYDYYGPATATPNRLKSVSEYNRSSKGVANQLRKTDYSYVLHPSGMLQTVTVDGPRTDVADISTWSFDSSGNLIGTQNAAGHVKTFSGYNSLGVPESMTNENGVVTHYTYDARGSLLTEVVYLPGEFRTTTYGYTALGRLEKITRPGGSQIVYLFDNVGRISGFNRNGYQQIDISRNNLSAITRIVYVNSCPTGEVCAKGSIVHFQKDYQIDEAGRIMVEIGANGQRREYRYDPNGNLIEIKDVGSTNRVTTLAYGPNNELTTATDPASNAIKYTYDGSGRVATITDGANRVTTYVYDGLGNLVSATSPNTGTSTFVFDAAGNQKSQTRADASVVTSNYDVLGRLTSRVSGSRTNSYTYDSCTNGKGLLCANSGAGGTKSVTYTKTGAVETQTSIINGATYSQSMTYDSLDRLVSLTYPNGVKISYEYNNQDQVTSVKSTIGGTVSVLASDIGYRYFGPYSTLKFGNNVTKTYGYDLSGRRSYEDSNLTYTYNVFNELTAVANSVAPVENLAFTYDAKSRLINETGPSGVANAFTLTANDNRAINNNFIYFRGTTSDRLNQVKIGANPFRNYTYDGRGNRSTVQGNGGNFQYEYDAITNNLTKFTNGTVVTQYTYDGFNLRVRKDGPAGTYSYIHGTDGRLLAETGHGSTTIASNYVWLGGELIAIIRSGAIYYVQNDHVNRPKIVTSSSGSIVWKASNTAFDRTVPMDIFGGLNLGLPGQYFDVESGLWANWYRYYDPFVGAYIQSDPLGQLGGANSYSYVGGNPVGRIDPLGLKDYSICETEAFLAREKYDAEEPLLIATVNMLLNHGAAGNFDFAETQTVDTFNVRGTIYSSGQFGNFIAGYGGAYYAGSTGVGLVHLGGIGFNALEGAVGTLRRSSGGREFDWDRSSRPYINAGAQRAYREMDTGSEPGCGCYQ